MRLTRDVLEAIEGRARAGVAAGRRQHAHAATRAQSLSRRRRLSDRRHSLERKIKEAIVAVQIEKRYTKREISDPLRQPDVVRARHLRRRGGLAAVLRQVGQRADARRGGAARRHHPVARAPESVRQHGRARRAGATTCCSGWPTRATSRSRRPTPPSKKPIVTRGQPTQPPGHRAVLRRGGPQASRAAVRREGALRERPLGDDDARSDAAADRPTARSSTACGASTSATATASRRATSSPRGRRSRLQGRALGAADRRRRRRAGGRRSTASRAAGDGARCGSGAITPT